ncbi:hypothetical protein BJX66DRAFT_77397 [Aspergillus keveii]|uniref:Uncharacterized protein n=1 Tax=Aspergillus keveii TaxID=714993 RepID=A0ABR4FNM3_9EURO
MFHDSESGGWIIFRTLGQRVTFLVPWLFWSVALTKPASPDITRPSILYVLMDATRTESPLLHTLWSYVPQSP